MIVVAACVLCCYWNARCRWRRKACVVLGVGQLGAVADDGQLVVGRHDCCCAVGSRTLNTACTHTFRCPVAHTLPCCCTTRTTLDRVDQRAPEIPPPRRPAHVHATQPSASLPVKLQYTSPVHGAADKRVPPAPPSPPLPPLLCCCYCSWPSSVVALKDVVRCAVRGDKQHSAQPDHRRQLLAKVSEQPSNQPAMEPSTHHITAQHSTPTPFSHQAGAALCCAVSDCAAGF